jgi:hypothetical protein
MVFEDGGQIFKPFQQLTVQLGHLGMFRQRGDSQNLLYLSSNLAKPNVFKQGKDIKNVSLLVVRIGGILQRQQTYGFSVIW